MQVVRVSVGVVVEGGLWQAQPAAGFHPFGKCSMRQQRGTSTGVVFLNAHAPGIRVRLTAEQLPGRVRAGAPVGVQVGARV